MGQIANLCSGDIFKQLQEKYGETFVKLMVAEKSKDFVGQEYGKVTNKVNQTFKGFQDKTTIMVDEKNRALTSLFQDVKSKVNNTIPGGVATIEKAKGQSINQFSGFNNLQNQITSIKTQAFTKFATQKSTIHNQLENQKSGMISKIESQRPKIPVYEELPDPLKNVVRNQAQTTFADQINKNKGAIAETIMKQANLGNLQGVFSKLSPQGALNGIIGNAGGQFANALGLGGLGGGLSNMLGGGGNSFGGLGKLF